MNRQSGNAVVHSSAIARCRQARRAGHRWWWTCRLPRGRVCDRAHERCARRSESSRPGGTSSRTFRHRGCIHAPTTICSFPTSTSATAPAAGSASRNGRLTNARRSPSAYGRRSSTCLRARRHRAGNRLHEPADPTQPLPATGDLRPPTRPRADPPAPHPLPLRIEPRPGEPLSPRSSGSAHIGVTGARRRRPGGSHALLPAPESG